VTTLCDPFAPFASLHFEPIETLRSAKLGAIKTAIESLPDA
jgi:hypothetical protein